MSDVCYVIPDFNGTPVKLKEDYELTRFNGIGETTVYKGGISNLEKVNLTWRKEWKQGEERLRLSEIVKQLRLEQLITITIQEPLRGVILQRGNYDDSWYLIGSTCGYA